METGTFNIVGESCFEVIKEFSLKHFALSYVMIFENLIIIHIDNFDHLYRESEYTVAHIHKTSDIKLDIKLITAGRRAGWTRRFSKSGWLESRSLYYMHREFIDVCNENNFKLSKCEMEVVKETVVDYK